MGDPATQLRAVGAATEELRTTAEQALEWVRVSEERVARAEARNEEMRVELKERAMATLRKLNREAAERVSAERGRRRQVEARATRAEAARDRAERAFEQSQKRAREDDADAVAKLRSRHGEELARVRDEADQRIAAAEQRAAETEAAAAKAHEIAVRLEAEIEERVMQGTEDVRREADERVRALVEKVEGEAADLARARAEEALKAESERIRVQADQREARIRRTAEDEIKASASRARREVLAAADATAPSWARREASAQGSGYRTF